MLTDFTRVDHWTELLDQDEIWQDRNGVQRRLADMSPLYCSRVAAFILRNPDAVVDYITSDLAAYGAPDGFQASIDYENGLAQFFDETRDSAAWLRRQPLVEALLARANSQPAVAPIAERAEQQEADPFGPYEYVEAADRCLGAEGKCPYGRCNQRHSTCRCACPACCGDTPDVWGAPHY